MNRVNTININSICSQQNNWIIVNNFKDIVNHNGKKTFKFDHKTQTLNAMDSEEIASEILHVYFCFADTQQMYACVHLYDDRVLFINNKSIAKNTETTETDNKNNGDDNDNGGNNDDNDNTNADKSDIVLNEKQIDLATERTIDSELVFMEYVDPAFFNGFCSDLLINDKCKLLDWSRQYNTKIKGLDYTNTSYYDVIKSHYNNKTIERFVSASSHLNLSHLYIITNDHLEEMTDHSYIDSIIMNQNIKIKNMDWIQHFPNIKSLTIIECHHITSENIKNVVKQCKKLETVILKSCALVDMDVFEAVATSSSVINFNIVNEHFSFKKYKDVVTTGEFWKKLYNESIKNISICSNGVTTDDVYYICKYFKSINNFYITGGVFDEIKESISTYNDDEDQKINFIVFDNTQRVLTNYKPISFRGLKKNMFSFAFSNSMMKMIERHNK
jgi:hypothetical protein